MLTIGSGRFPQDIKFECVKDKVTLVAGMKPGDKVKVSFDLRGREWKENWHATPGLEDHPGRPGRCPG